ncbi:hypothetical protein APE_0885a [Aeropyrum pernix spindle-shaped virus 1]|uniref:Uncharacterized protein n=1 Tax=Aeropyrum pernix (strain ATCC 700893 / DSM 11879 / JCM 9820 / NBRC 100138 / K1) TaxID=272557 RepID=Q05E39_AERPE|nr:hypothetical protein [Aeropyrum pernix]BAF34762.1 hypothetical protein APE_0885a [Aeropyrum pernix spindle-shaped virus 1] [Aeropyrum pernix K1]
MLSVSFTGRISKRRGQVLVLLPRDYWQLFQGLRGKKVRVRVGEVEYTGRITVIEERVYVSLPFSALALRERSRYHLIRLEV